MTLGVDLYRYQTVTDYPALGRVAGYAWVKVSDGTGPAKVRGDVQVSGCRRAGIPVGGYHYAQPGDPEKQADVLLAECRRLGALGLAPALDLEAPFVAGEATRYFGIRFCRRVAQAGYRPAVYMSASWAGIMRPDTWGIPNLVIWLAAYGTNNGTRASSSITNHYSGRYDVHQYTSMGRLPGVAGTVDLNWAQTGIPANTPAPGGEMKNLVLAREKDGPAVWVGDGITRRHVADEKELEGLQFWISEKGGDPTVHEGWEDLRVLGEVDDMTKVSVTLDPALLTQLAAQVVDKLGALRFEAGVSPTDIG